jgi:hypothetical protein
LVVLLAGCGGASEVDLDSAARAITAIEAGAQAQAQARDVADSNPMPGQPPMGDPASSNPMPGAPAATPLAPAAPLAPGASNPMPGVVTTPLPAADSFADQTR